MLYDFQDRPDDVIDHLWQVSTYQLTVYSIYKTPWRHLNNLSRLSRLSEITLHDAKDTPTTSTYYLC